MRQHVATHVVQRPSHAVPRYRVAPPLQRSPSWLRQFNQCNQINITRSAPEHNEQQLHPEAEAEAVQQLQPLVGQQQQQQQPVQQPVHQPQLGPEAGQPQQQQQQPIPEVQQPRPEAVQQQPQPGAEQQPVTEGEQQQQQEPEQQQQQQQQHEQQPQQPQPEKELEPYALFADVSKINGLVQVIKVREDEPTLPKPLHNSLVLTLEGSGLPQSIYREGPLAPTNAYWDRLAALAWLPDLPAGPIGVYGWGAGTVPRLILQNHVAPPRIFGWEHDPEVLEMTAMAMDAEELAEHPVVTLKAGDALARDAVVRAGFAGLIVDLVNGHGVMPQLTQAKTWNSLRLRLRPGGRIMAHLGPFLQDDGEPNMATVVALNAMREAFEGQLWVADFDEDTDPCLTSAVAIGGRAPNAEGWIARLPRALQHTAVGWVYWEGL